MKTKTRCEVCNKDFKNKEGLDMHNSSKHSQSEGKSLKINYKKIRNWGIFIIIIGLILFLIAFPIYKSIKENSKLNFDAPKGAIHWHPQITIIIDGVKQIIPGGIGLGSGGHRPTHTHEADGTIHMENNNPSKKTVTLGYFFDTWGKKFNNECIFNYCIDKGELKMSVNGKENFDFDNYFMQNGDKIVIEYTSLK